MGTAEFNAYSEF